MPREGTKTMKLSLLIYFGYKIEIRYAPGGDENPVLVMVMYLMTRLRLDMPREGTKTEKSILFAIPASIEIRYAPGGDENFVVP